MADWLAHLLNPLRPLCDAWCLQWWEMLGSWFTGLATFAAVIASLWLAQRQARPQLMIWADKQKLISGARTEVRIDPAKYPDKLVIEFANTGAVPVKITGVWFALRFPAWLRWLGLRPRYALFQNPPQSWTQLPIELAPAQYQHWVLEYEYVLNNIVELSVGTTWPWWRQRLRMMRVHARTSVDIVVAGPLRRRLVEDIRERVKLLRREQRQSAE